MGIKQKANLAELINACDIIVTVGSGGVGKTTTAAAISLYNALQGRRTLALTIDPAYRLADSLGIPEIGNVEKEIDLSGFGTKENHSKKGELWAMMLEAKRTFDNMVEKYAPSKESAQKIFANSFYQHISGALSGSQEYMAIEKLSELHEEKRFELIVLDTPPTAHALDFLTAPERMLAFLDQSVLQWFLRPYLTLSKLGFKTFKMSSTTLLKLGEKITGAEVIRDFLEFFESFDGMYEGFKQRSETVNNILHRPETGFLLVATPQKTQLEEAMAFHSRLKSMGITLMGVVVNRATVLPNDGKINADEIEKELESAFAKINLEFALIRELVQQITETTKIFAHIMAEEEKALENFSEKLGRDVPLFIIPRFEEDIHDLQGLYRFASVLFSENFA